MATRSISVKLRAEINSFKADMAAASKASSDAAKQTETAWDKSNSHMGKMMQSAKQNERAWNTTGGVLTAVGGGMIALGTAATKSGIEFNSLKQTAGAALSSVMGSAEGAARQMDKMNEFGRDTWVMRDSLIRAQQTMTGFGIATEKVVPYMDALAETVAATTGSNQDFEELARVMGKVESEGKITATTFREFGTRGVDAAQLIGDSMGMTAGEIRDSVTKGTLDAGEAMDALAEGMKSRFDGATDALRNTFEGAFNNAFAAWRDLSAAMAEPLVGEGGGGLAVGGLNALADGLSELRDVAEGTPDAVKIAAGGLGGLASVATLAAGGFLLLAPRIVETQTAFRTLAGQDDLVGKAAQGLGRMAPAMRGIVKAGGAAAVIGGMGVALASIVDRKSLEGVANSTREVAAALTELEQSDDALDRLFQRTDGSGIIHDVENLGDALDRTFNRGAGERFNDWAESVIQSVTPIRGSTGMIADQFALLDEEMARLVESGNAGDAARMFQVIKEQSGLGADEMHRLSVIVPEYEAALEVAGGAAGEAAGGVAELSGEAIEAQEKLQEASESLQANAMSFADFADKTTDAELSLRSWIDMMEEQVAAQEEWGDNLQTLLDRGAAPELMEHLYDLGVEGAFRVKELADGTEEDLARAGDAMGALADGSVELTDSIYGIPDINLEADDTTLRTQLWFAKDELEKLHRMEPSPTTDLKITELEDKIRIAEEQLGDLDNAEARPLVGVSGADQSRGKIEGVHDALLAVPADVESKIDVDDAPARGTMERLWEWIRGTTIFFKTDEQKASGTDHRGNTSPRPAGGRATGGAIYGPGTGTSDSIPAWLSNGEHVWTAKEVRRAGGQSAMYAMRQALMSGDIPGFASGGAVATARGNLATAERELERIQKQGRSTTASDRRREAAQKRVEREREALRKAEEEQARRQRVRDLQADFRTDTRRGRIQDQVTGSLSGGYSAVDRMFGLGSNEDLSASARNMANSRARKFEADLRRLYGQAERVDEKLDDAQDKAKELEGIQRSVSSSLMGDRGVDMGDFMNFSGGQWTTHTGVSGANRRMTADVGRMKEFANKLQKLMKAGIPGAILQEIAEAGVDEGIALADAFLNASGSEQQSYISTWGEYEKQAQRIGNIVTGGFYDGGVDAAQGVVSGLESQQKSIEAQIAQLAKGMEDTLKSVLGIRSPSRVMAELGEFTAAGLVQGILSGRSDVAGAAESLAGAAVPNMRYDIDMTASPVVDTDALAASGAMQDMSAITLMAMQEMRAAVGEGWMSMLSDTQAAQLGMLTDTQAKQFSMRDVTAAQQEQMRAIVLGRQTAMRDTTAALQEETRATVQDRQLRSRQSVSSEQELMRSIMAEKQTSMRDRNRTEFESMRATTGEKLRAMRSSADTTMSGFSGDYDGHMGVLKTHNREAHSIMESTSKEAFQGIRSGMNKQMRSARPELGERMNSLIDVLAKFTTSVNDAFGDVGVNLDAPRKLSFATGGVMPGYTPGRDVHSFYSPTAGSLYLSGGEAIMRPEFTRAIGGEAGVKELNSLARGGRTSDMNSMLHTAMYANGGVLPPIDGVTAFRDSGVWRSLFGAVKERFPNVNLHSAYRPGAITATGNPSQHGLGNAIDITPRMDIAEWIRENFGGGTRELIFSPMGGRQINRGRNHMYTGVTRSMHFDHIHWAVEQMLQGVMPYTGDGSYSGGAPVHPFLDRAGVSAGTDLEKSYREAAQKLMTDIMDTHTGQLSGMNPMMQDLGTGIMQKAKAGLIDKAAEHGESMKFVMPGGEGVARWRDTVVQALRYAGLPQTDDYVGAWLRQIQSESGGNPNIMQQVRDVNSGGNEAQGLVQVIPGTFASFRDQSLPNDRTHPLANLVAGMNWAKYKAGRQGRDMLSFIGHGHGYKDGTASAKSGWAVVGEEGPELLKLNGGERIESNPDTRKLLAANRTFIPGQQSGIDERRLAKALGEEIAKHPRILQQIDSRGLGEEQVARTVANRMHDAAHMYA